MHATQAKTMKVVVSLSLFFVFPALAGAQRETTLLRHRFVAGEKRLYTKVQKRVMKSQLGERQVTQQMTRTTDMTLVIEKVRPDGSAQVRHVINRIRLVRTGAGENFAYDSARKAKSGDTAASLTSIGLDALAGAEFAFVMTPRGDVQNVQPTAKTTAKLTKAGAAGLLPTLTAGVRYLAPALPLPADPVAVGTTWTDPLRLDVPSFGTITGTYAFTYRGAGEKPAIATAHIETASSDVSLKPEANALIAAKVDAFNQTGTVDWDTVHGRLMRHAATGTMTMTATLGDKTATQNAVSTDTLQLTAVQPGKQARNAPKP